MQSVNMLQAKSSLSRLVEAIELGREREIIIAREITITWEIIIAPGNHHFLGES